MKNYLFLLCVALTFTDYFSQVITPKASPLCKIEQRVGLTDISIAYSRPSVNGRVIFGDLIPYDTYWRLGANEHTKITLSDALYFGNDTVPAGTYALYAKPGKTEWVLAFYNEIGAWGLPKLWEDSKVTLTVNSPVIMQPSSVENLTIEFDQMDNNGAELLITWDLIKVSFPFKVNSKEKVLASIQKTMNGPTANDYHAAAKYYLDEKINNLQALEWVDKAVVLRPEAYWMLRTKSLIQATMGDFKGAINTAEQCMKMAEADEDSAYVSQCKNSITEWKKQK